MRFAQPRYRFPLYLQDVTRMGRVYKLSTSYGESVVIPNNSAMAIARGYATIMCNEWSRDGWNCQGMMEINGREFLAEVGLPAKLLPVMVKVASKYPVPECPMLEPGYDWDSHPRLPAYE